MSCWLQDLARVLPLRSGCSFVDRLNETQDVSQIEDINKTQIFLMPIIRIVVTRPARTVGPSNFKSGGFVRSRGSAALGTCMPVART